MTSTGSSVSPPPALRARLAADYRPVRPLRSPRVRVLAVLPFALLALVAAPLWFEIRPDAIQLGWTGSWGVSLAQAAMGLGLIGAALRESVPGRAWSRGALALWLALPMALVVAVTWTTWSASPVVLGGSRSLVAVMCFAGSLATALPMVAVGVILATRAFPLRPGVTGLLTGLGAGLAADAGWRLFCHFSEPAHVLSAHLGGVLAAALAGVALSRLLPRRG